jgi:hypothetical protein
MHYTSATLKAQYLNVRQRRLGNIIIQTVNILQHESADHKVTAHERFLQGQLKLFPINLARNTFVSTE